MRICSYLICISAPSSERDYTYTWCKTQNNHDQIPVSLDLSWVAKSLPIPVIFKCGKIRYQFLCANFCIKTLETIYRPISRCLSFSNTPSSAKSRCCNQGRGRINPNLGETSPSSWHCPVLTGGVTTQSPSVKG